MFSRPKFFAAVAASMFGALVAFFPGTAHAVILTDCGGVDLDQGTTCSLAASADCSTQCTAPSFQLQCSADLEASCSGGCSAMIDASCTTACVSSCTGGCSSGSFSCEGSCDTDCNGHCSSHCQSNPGDAGTTTDCEASCKETCDSSCSGSCTGTAPMCTPVTCQAECQGSCQAQANLNCQVNCQESGTAMCEANYTAAAHGLHGRRRALLQRPVRPHHGSPGLRNGAHQPPQHQRERRGTASCSGGTCASQGSASCGQIAPGAMPMSEGFLAVGLGAGIIGAVRRRARKAKKA